MLLYPVLFTNGNRANRPIISVVVDIELIAKRIESVGVQTMLQMLQDFEQTAARFTPIVLVVPGVIAVIIGLFVWLGGLGFRRVLAVVLGAVAGWICGYFIADKNIIAAAASAVVVAVIAVMLQRAFITVLAASLAAILTFFVFVGICPEVMKATENVNVIANKLTEKDEVIEIGLAAVVLKAYIIDFSNMVREAALNMRTSGWAAMAGSGVLLLVIGVLFRRLISALCYAVIGTMLIFTGMISLVLYKGSMPISIIRDKFLYYAAVFGFMVVFGTFVQLLLGPSLEKKVKKGKQPKKGKKGKTDEPTQRSYNRWRT
jgi:hypothetical protein